MVKNIPNLLQKNNKLQADKMMKHIYTKILILLVSLFAFQGAFANGEYSQAWANQHNIQHQTFTSIQLYDSYAASTGHPTSYDLHQMATAVGFFDPSNHNGVGDDSIYGSGAAYAAYATQHGLGPLNYNLRYPDGSVVHVRSSEGSFQVYEHTKLQIESGRKGSVSLDTGLRLVDGLNESTTTTASDGSVTTTFDLNDGDVTAELSGGIPNSDGTTTYYSINYLNNSNVTQTIAGLQFDPDTINIQSDIGQHSSSFPTHLNAGNREFAVTGSIASFPETPYNFHRLIYFYSRDPNLPGGYRLREIIIDETIFDSEAADINYSQTHELLDLLNIPEDNRRKRYLLKNFDFTSYLHHTVTGSLPLSTGQIAEYIAEIDEELDKEDKAAYGRRVLDMLNKHQDRDIKSFLNDNQDFSRNLFLQMISFTPLSDQKKEEFITRIEEAIIAAEEAKCKEDQLDNCPEWIINARELMNNAPPIGSNREVIIDYERQFATIIEQTGGETNKIVSTVYGNASNADLLNLEAHSKILQNINSTLQQAEPVNFNIGQITNAEGLRIVTEDTVETAALTELPEDGELEFSDYLEIAQPFLVEALIAFLPGSDIIDLIRSISNDDKVGVAFALGGLIASTVGGSAIKGAIKSIRAFRKVTILTRKLGRAVKAAVNAAKKGFKTTLDAGGNLLLKKGNAIIARGDDAVKSFLKAFGTKIDDVVEDIARIDLPPSVANTFTDGAYRTVKTKSPVNLNRGFGGDAKLGGGFATTKPNATRNELALLDEWNNNLRFEAKIEVPTGQTLNIGKVAPQTSSNGLQTLTGGGDQILMPQNWNTRQWVKEVVDKTTGQTYTYDQFRNLFPHLL